MQTNPTFFVEDMENVQTQEATRVAPALSFTDEEILNLQESQIKSLTKEQIGKISAQQISLLSETQLAAFSTEQISFLTQEQITGKQYVGNYWTPDISFHEVGISNNSRLLSADQIIALGDKVLCLGTIAIANLSEEATKALPEEYIAQFTPGQTRGLNIKFLSSTQIKALGDGISGLATTQLADLGTLVCLLSLNATTALTPDQIRTLTATQVSWFRIQQVKILKQIQIAALSRNQISSFSIAQIKALFKDSPQYVVICISMCFEFHPSILSKEQIIELGDSILNFTSHIISKLSFDAIQGIAAEYINQFTTTQIRALNVAALSTNQICAMSAETVAALLPTQLRQMGIAIIHLSKEAIHALTESQLLALSLEQITALTQNETTLFSGLYTQNPKDSANTWLTPADNQQTNISNPPFNLNDFIQYDIFFNHIIQNLTETVYSYITENNTINAVPYFVQKEDAQKHLIAMSPELTKEDEKGLAVIQYALILDSIILSDFYFNKSQPTSQNPNNQFNNDSITITNDPIQLKISIDQVIQDTHSQNPSFPENPTTPFLTNVSKDIPNYTQTIFTLINVMGSTNNENLEEIKTHSLTESSLAKIFSMDSAGGHMLPF